jgi:hypothetical protein
LCVLKSIPHCCFFFSKILMVWKGENEGSYVRNTCTNHKMNPTHFLVNAQKAEFANIFRNIENDSSFLH